MKRLAQAIFSNLFCIPGLMARLDRYARNPEKYSRQERMALIRTISDKIRRGGKISLVVSETEHFPAEGGFLICPNHQGLFDALAVAAAVDFPLSPVLKKEIMSWPVVWKLAVCADAMPMDRGDLRQSVRVMRELQERLEEGRACLVFPEGTRSRSNELGAFKPGCFKPAVKARCPIVPVALVNSFLPFDTKVSGPVTVYLHVLKPLLWEDYQSMTTAQIAETVKEQIRQEMASILSQGETQAGMATGQVSGG